MSLMVPTETEQRVAVAIGDVRIPPSTLRAALTEVYRLVQRTDDVADIVDTILTASAVAAIQAMPQN